MKKFPIWAVAAAILLKDDNDPLHYTDVAELVDETCLTNLAIYGTTPKQTVGAILRTHPIFHRVEWPRGYYRLVDPKETRQLWKVQQVIRKLEEQEQEERKENRRLGQLEIGRA